MKKPYIVCATSIGALLLVAVPARATDAVAALGAELPAAAVSIEPNDTTEMIGLRFRDADIVRAIEFLENGETPRGIDLLINLINDKSRNESSRNKELRVALAMLQIRDPDPKAPTKGESAISGIVSLESNKTDLLRRAEVIKLMSDDRIKNGDADIADLKSRENWMSRLRIVRRHLEIQLDEKDRQLEEALKRDDNGFARIRELMVAKNYDSLDAQVFQMHAIQIEREHTGETITNHAARLRAVMQGVNSQLRSFKQRLSDLRRTYDNSAGPKRADNKNRYNRVQKTAEQWHGAGEKIVEHHRDLATALKVPPLGIALETCPGPIK